MSLSDLVTSEEKKMGHRVYTYPEARQELLDCAGWTSIKLSVDPDGEIEAFRCGEGLENLSTVPNKLLHLFKDAMPLGVISLECTSDAQMKIDMYDNIEVPCELDSLIRAIGCKAPTLQTAAA